MVGLALALPEAEGRLVECDTCFDAPGATGMEGGNEERGRARVSVSIQTQHLANQVRCCDASCRYKKEQTFNVTLNIQQFQDDLSSCEEEAWPLWRPQ